jgi:hypothetical protein
MSYKIESYMYMRVLQSLHPVEHLLISKGPSEAIDFMINRSNAQCRVQTIVHAEDGTSVANPRAVLSVGQTILVAERYINADDRRGIQPFVALDGNTHLYPVVHKVAPVISTSEVVPLTQI